MGCVPVLSAAYGSLRSCECLLESKFVKRDGSSMNEHSGWEALPPLSPLTIRAETVERFSCHNIQAHTHTHTHSHDVYTHMYTCTHSQNLVWFNYGAASCFIFSSASYHFLLDSFHFFLILLYLLSSHLLYHQPHSDRPQQWRHGVKQN